LRQLLRQYRRERGDNLLGVGIRSKLRPIERAAFIKEYSEKKLKNIIQAGPGAFGNAATRIEALW